MMNNPYLQASQSYQNTGDENLGQMEIVLELYKGLIKFFTQAKNAHAKGDFEQMNYFLQRNHKIVEALYAHLDMEAGGKDAVFLHDFYATLIGRMSKILDRPDVQREFDQLIAYVKPVYEQWYVLTHGALPGAKEGNDDSDDDSAAQDKEPT